MRGCCDAAAESTHARRVVHVQHLNGYQVEIYISHVTTHLFQILRNACHAFSVRLVAAATILNKKREMHCCQKKALRALPREKSMTALPTFLSLEKRDVRCLRQRTYSNALPSAFFFVGNARRTFLFFP